MNVKELITELKKWPPDYEVVTSAHDNEPHEFQSRTNSLFELEDGEFKSDILSGRSAVVISE